MPPTPRPGSKSRPPPTWAHYLNTSIDLPSLSSIAWQAPGAQLPQPKAAIPIALINPDPIAWIEQHFYIPETRGPITLAAYQQQAIRAALATDDDGLLRYSTIVYSDIKKSAKSTIAAAIILWRALQIDAHNGWGSIYIVANDLKQADSRVAYYLRRAITLNPMLRAVCTVRVGSYKVTLPNHTFIEAIPIDPSGEAGSNADMVVFSELWGAHSKAQSHMWTEMTLPPTKYGRALRWVETYAGVKGGAPLLEQLYEQGVQQGRQLDADLELFDNPTARLLCLWNTRPRLPWQTDAYYAQEQAVLLPSEFARVHRNQWSEGGADAFLSDMALWDACREPLPPLTRRTPLVLVVDAGISSDTFAIIGLSRHPARHDDVAVRLVQVYVPSGQPLDFNGIQDDLIALIRAHNVVELAYDPLHIHQMMMTIRQRGLCVVRPFHQGADRLIADYGLLQLIVRRGVAHDGNPILRQHLANADRKVEAGVRDQLRIVKRDPSRKIDAAVALAMGAHRCLKLPL